MTAEATDLRGLTVAGGVERVRCGELEAAAWFDAYASADDGLGAFLWRAESPSAAGEGELAGAPIAIKDIFCTENIPTTAGSRILEGHRPAFTATAVSRLIAAGASVVGKTNMDEFAMGSSNENSAYGPVQNPGQPGACPGARRVDPRPPSPAGWRPLRLEPTPAARFASRRRSAGSSG